MNLDNIYLYCYELAYKDKSDIPLQEKEIQEIRQILLAKDNFTYTELNQLEADTVELIYTVISAYNQGQEFKQKTKSNHHDTRNPTNDN